MSSSSVDKREIAGYGWRVNQPAGSQGPSHRTRAGANIRHLVGMHDLRREQFAGYVGISSAGLRDIMNGKSEPSLATVRRIATAFGLTIDDLYATRAHCLRVAAIGFERAPVRSAGLDNRASAD
jgi:DNA-binding XRE family transcriptional regulator